MEVKSAVVEIMVFNKCPAPVVMKSDILDI